VIGEADASNERCGNAEMRALDERVTVLPGQFR